MPEWIARYWVEWLFGIVAEIELVSEDQAFDKPRWVGEEVTGDPRYFNSNLIKHPFTKW